MLPTCVKHCVAARIILLLVLELRPLTHLHSQGLAGASCGRLHTMVRPVETMLRTLRMTIAAARASRPAPALPSTQDGRGVRSYDDTLLPRLASSVAAHEVTWRYTRNARMHRAFRPHATGSTDAGVCAPLVGSSMNTMLGLATCTMSASTIQHQLLCPRAAFQCQHLWQCSLHVRQHHCSATCKPRLATSSGSSSAVQGQTAASNHLCTLAWLLRLGSAREPPECMYAARTSSTAMVSRLRCSTLSPDEPGRPTSACASGCSSTRSMICAARLAGRMAFWPAATPQVSMQCPLLQRRALHTHWLHNGAPVLHAYSLGNVNTIYNPNG